jgi:hypothetical protein
MMNFEYYFAGSWFMFVAAYSFVDKQYVMTILLWLFIIIITKMEIKKGRLK